MYLWVPFNFPKTVDSADGDPEAATHCLGGDLASARKQVSLLHKEESASHTQLSKPAFSFSYKLIN